MFRWTGVIFSLIAVVLLGVAGFANGMALAKCAGDPRVHLFLLTASHYSMLVSGLSSWELA